MAAMKSVKSIKCPTCKKTGDWFAGDFGPFCSRRCRLIDLGKWLGEENAIREPLRPDHFADEELMGQLEREAQYPKVKEE
jgi:endogenous inhibitor of DNA gyrase (YacG/DUF329 family)